MIAPWRRFVLPGALLTALVTACSAAPPGQLERALYEDLRIIVESREATEWIVDSYEVDSVAPSAFRSVCRVSPASRAALRVWLDDAIEAGGGPSEKAWREAGGDLDAIDELLTLERVQALLKHTDAMAASSCPFYIQPEADFTGIHGDADRFVLLAESTGGGAVFLRRDAMLFGGGGGGRILAAWGIGPRWTVGVGAEMGGGGAFDLDTKEDQALSATVYGAVPVLVRLRDETNIFDLDLAVLAGFTTNDVEWPPGFRISLGTGILAPRVASFMPTAVVQVGYELHPARGGQEVAHVIRLGTRIGIDFDP